MLTDIRQLIPRDNYLALINANLPTALNPYATLADIAGPPISNPLDDVIDDLNTPPGGPTTGDRYIVGPAPIGAWVGNANNITEWDGAMWVYTVVVADDTVYVTADGQSKRFNGVSWVPYPGTAVLIGGNNVGSPMTIGPRTAQGLRFRSGVSNIVRLGNASSTFNHSMLIGSASIGTPPDVSAVLEVTKRKSGSLNGGLLIPRVTTAEKNGIGTPATGLLVFDTDLGLFSYYDGAVWQTLDSSSVSEWALNGNTVGSVKSIGTIDAFDFPIITTNVEVARFYANGKFSIGQGAVVTDISNIAIGTGAQSLLNRGVAIGDGARSDSQGVSVGFGTRTGTDRGVAIGYWVRTQGLSISIGSNNADISPLFNALDGSISIGTDAHSRGVQGIGIGQNSNIATGSSFAIALGNNATVGALGVRAIVIGAGSSNASYSYTIGSGTGVGLLVNNTPYSLGIGWDEATPTVLFAKTTDQYINGTGNLGIGLTVPTAKLHVRGTTASAGNKVFILQNSNPTTLFDVDDYGRFAVNTTTAYWEDTFVIKKSSFPTSDVLFSVVDPTNNYRNFSIYNTGANTGDSLAINLGSANASFPTLAVYPYANLTHGSIRINGTGGTSYQVFSNSGGVNRDHIAFQNGASGDGMFLNQDGVGDYRFIIAGGGAGAGHHLLYGGTNQNSYLCALSSQSLGIGTVSPNASAKFQIDSVTKGFLPPRMTTAQRIAIPSPANGLLVYDTDLNQWYGWNSLIWTVIG